MDRRQALLLPLVSAALTSTSSAEPAELTAPIVALDERFERSRGKDRPDEDLMASDYVGIGVGGTLYDKAQSERLYSSGRVQTASLTVSDRLVRVYGEVAVVTGVRHVQDRMDGRDRDERHRFTRVWARRGGRWQVVSFQATRVSEGAGS